MKKLLTLTLALLLLLMPMTAMAANAWDNLGGTTGTSTNTVYATEAVAVRNGPGTQYSVVGYLAAGEKVELVGTYGNWSLVIWNNQYGYVASSYLTTYYYGGGTGTNYNWITAVATVNTVVRTGPGTYYPQAATLAKGQTVLVRQVSNGWAEVSLTSGYVGYVAASDLKEVSSGQQGTTGSSTTAVTLVRAQVRTGPGTQYSLLGTISANLTVTVTAISGNWAKIIISSGADAYVSVSDLKFNGNVNVPNSGTTTYATSTGRVNVRKGPGSNYSKLGQVKKGDKLQVLGESGKWLKVSWNNTTAYVFKQYFKLSTTTTTTPGGSYPNWNYGTSLTGNQILDQSGYFTTNRYDYLGVFADYYGGLNVRLRRNSNVDKINNDLQAIFKSTGRTVRVAESSMPNYVNYDYIQDLINQIKVNYTKLTTAQRQECTISDCYYDAKADAFYVKIKGLNADKQAKFTSWISNWSYITFISG